MPSTSAPTGMLAILATSVSLRVAEVLYRACEVRVSVAQSPPEAASIWPLRITRRVE